VLPSSLKAYEKQALALLHQMLELNSAAFFYSVCQND
jgi:hypothetical protein